METNKQKANRIRHYRLRHSKNNVDSNDNPESDHDKDNHSESDHDTLSTPDDSDADPDFSPVSSETSVVEDSDVEEDIIVEPSAKRQRVKPNYNNVRNSVDDIIDAVVLRTATSAQMENENKRSTRSSLKENKEENIKKVKVDHEMKENAKMVKVGYEQKETAKKVKFGYEEKANAKKVKLYYYEEKENSNDSPLKKKKSKIKDESLKVLQNGDTRDDFNPISGMNYVKLFSELERGFCKSSSLNQIAEDHYVGDLRWFHITERFESSAIRITAMQWHPSIANMFVLAGRDGCLTMFLNEKMQEPGPHCIWDGIGEGGKIAGVQFYTKSSGVEVVSAIDGTITKYNFETKTIDVLADTTMPECHWFCTVDIHQDEKIVLGGDNKGFVTVHHSDNNKPDHIRLHSSKISYLEFNKRDPNVLVTAALDKTVKLWDLRKLDRYSFTDSLQHDCGISSAKFSRTDGCRLVTTDTNCQLRVYKAPTWFLEQKIIHPHRNKPHLANINASWHPRADLFVAGRFPDPKLPNFKKQMRSVDVYSATTGQVRRELMDASRLITSLTLFNSSGSCLATTCGRTLYFWKSTRKFS